MRKMKRLSRTKHDNLPKNLTRRQRTQSEEDFEGIHQLSNDSSQNDVIKIKESLKYSYSETAAAKSRSRHKNFCLGERLRQICLHGVIVGLLVCLSSLSGVFAGYTNLYSCIKSPCQHGVCVDHLNSSYSCFCEDGFTGFECQTNWDECWSQPCRHGATCIDLNAAFECHCPPGYTGRLCDSEINECLSNPCQNNGTCEDFIDKYVCTCPAGYTGANCEVDVSVCNSFKESKCQHNGECIDGPGLHFYCNCTSGWRGELCEVDYNECLEAPCYNGGICVNQPGQFGCVCQNGFTGRLCEDKIIQCGTNPCLNGAYCVMENETATCYCVPDFHGHLCQDRYNDCLPYAPRCRNGGSCIDGVDSYKCSCPPNATGILCHCVLTPEGEKCEPLPEWFEDKPFHPRYPPEDDVPGTEPPTCHCKFNYTGAFCETYHYVTMPYFTGISYLKLDIGELSLRKGVQLYIQFTSESPNGLLSYSEGNAESFFMLLLRNSLLQFAFSCGLQTVSFLQGNQKLSFNTQTDVLVRLWWTPYTLFMPWGKGKCHASLQLNDSAPIYSEQEAASADVILRHLFLGGLSEAYHSPLVVKAGLLPRLRGCISLLEVNDIEIDPWLSAVEGEGIKECGKALCPPNACLNGGTCTPGPAQWSCSCPEGFEGELCERASCLNNPCFKGICLQSAHGDFGNPFCLCPAELNGPQCKKQLGHEIGTRLLYTGSYDGYASYSSHSIKLEHRRSFVIRLHFTTRYYNQLGLVFFLGQRVSSAKKDFIALALVRGFLLLTWDLGSGVRRIVTRDPIDTTWHTHSVRVGRSSKLAWLEVDTQGNISSFAPGFLSSLDTNKILYLGGHPTWNFTHLPRDLHKFQGFKGCIFDVRVAKSMEGPWMVPSLLASSGVGQCEMDLCKGHACLNGAACQPFGAAYRCICNPGWKGHFCSIPSHNCEDQTQLSCSVGSSCIFGGHDVPPRCLCPFGKAGKFCEKDVTITDPLFNTDRSYISILGGILLRGYTDISFEFKPSTVDGILLLAPPTTPQGDFLSLTLRNRTLTLAFKLGSYSSIVGVVSQTYVELGRWQTVSLLRRGNEGTLRFGNDIAISSSSNRFLEDSFGGLEKRTQATEMLDVQPELFLGGIPDPILLPMELLHLHNMSNFGGCIRNVRIGEQKFNLDAKMERFGVLRGQGIGDCDGTRCGSEVCNNGGTCWVNEANQTSCACPENYVDDTCQTPSSCVDHKCQKGGACEPIYIKRRNGKILDDYHCLCPPGQIGDHCENDGTVHSAQFRNRSYAIVTQGPFLGLQDPHKDYISLNFTSLEPHGLILWKGHINDPENDYYGLGIFRARLKFVWHLGGENIGEICPKQFICDGKWHSVSVTRIGKIVTLFLDGLAYKSTVDGEYSQLNAPNTVYVGGFPDNNYLKYATHLYFQKNNFVGCLRNVRLHAGSSHVVFSSLKEGRDLQQCRENDR